MSEQNYNVEKILGHKPKTAKKAADAKTYHIKWEGFSDKDNTWEPADNLNEPTIDEYWQSLEKANDKISAKDVAKEIVDEEVTAKNEPEEQNENEYVIESIAGVLPETAESDEEAEKYIIKWEGFGADENTTEPAVEIRESAPKCVTDFWKTKNTKKDDDDEESEKEEEVKLSKRGRKIKPIKPIVMEPKEPSKKKAKITPSKSKKRPSPTKKEEVKKEKKSPASKLKDDEETDGEFSETVNKLNNRLDKLETNDRKLLISLTKRNDLPGYIIDEIREHLYQ